MGAELADSAPHHLSVCDRDDFNQALSRLVQEAGPYLPQGIRAEDSVVVLLRGGRWI